MLIIVIVGLVVLFTLGMTNSGLSAPETAGWLFNLGCFGMTAVLVLAIVGTVLGVNSSQDNELAAELSPLWASGDISAVQTYVQKSYGALNGGAQWDWPIGLVPPPTQTEIIWVDEGYRVLNTLSYTPDNERATWHFRNLTAVESSLLRQGEVTASDIIHNASIYSPPE
ncbi:MAG: hypothetical protein V1719_01965 [Patescibacteria group bacterium]